MSERDAYVAKLKAMLDEWNAELTRHEARMRGAQADARLRYEQQISELKSNRDAAARKMRELQDASADAWDSLREGAQTAWDTMAQSLKDASERFK